MNFNSEKLSIGAETAECLSYLARTNPGIKQFGSVIIDRPAPLQERLNLTTYELKSFNEALHIRKETRLPFWDSLLLSTFDKGDFPDRLLEQAKFHQVTIGKEQWIDSQRVLQGELIKISRNHVGPSMLSILSQVRMINGEDRHFIFIDFHIPASPTNTRIVNKVASQLLNYPALIIESGVSYHLIGTKLVDQHEFRTTLANALLYGPITDRAYIAHQLIEGRAALRYSKGGHADAVPRLAAMTSLSKNDHNPPVVK